MYLYTTARNNQMSNMEPSYPMGENQQGRMTQPRTPYLPTGEPTGPAPIGTPRTPRVPTAPPGEQSPETLQSTLYTPGYLRTLIGRNIRVEFLIGTNAPLIDRTGILLGVGASYILIRPTDTDDVMMCDIYSIKFVTEFR